MNENCLDVMRCPGCGSYGPFDISVECTATMHDSGVEHCVDYEWDDSSWCNCRLCEYGEQVLLFKKGGKS